MTEAPPIPAVEKLRAIEREIGYCRMVYPRRVSENKMTQKQADWQQHAGASRREMIQPDPP